MVERHRELPPVTMPMLPFWSVDRGGKLVPQLNPFFSVHYYVSNCFYKNTNLVNCCVGIEATAMHIICWHMHTPLSLAFKSHTQWYCATAMVQPFQYGTMSLPLSYREVKFTFAFRLSGERFTLVAVWVASELPRSCINEWWWYMARRIMECYNGRM